MKMNLTICTLFTQLVSKNARLGKKFNLKVDHDGCRHMYVVIAAICTILLYEAIKT